MKIKSKVREIGNSKQLFIDDYIIEEKRNVSKALNPAKKHMNNPLIKSDQIWEGHIQFYGTVLYDERQRLFRMWYHGGPTSSLYATSKDGLHWEKPSLGLYEFEGSKENNIIPNGPGYVIYAPSIWEYILDLPEPLRKLTYQQLGIWKNPYKSFRAGFTKDGKSGWGAVFSGDGLHWTPHPDNPLLTGVGDECPVGQGSEKPQKGAYYTDWFPPRYISLPKVGAQVGRFRRRSVGLSTSENFIQWSEPSLILAPDYRDDEIAETRIHEALEDGVIDVDYPEDHRAEFYHLCVFPYEGMYLGFLDVFYAAAELRRIGQINQGGPNEIQMVSSRDLIHWERVGDREPIIHGGEAGDWDRGWKSTTNMPIIVGDEIWIYYGGTNTDHGGLVWTKKQDRCGIGLATLRLDGFVSVDAEGRGGMLTTKPLIFEGNKLVINAQAEGGSVAVEILNENCRPVRGFRRSDCDAFTGDSVRHTVTWKGSSDVSSLQGKVVRLCFYLKKTKLYSFTFQPQAL